MWEMGLCIGAWVYSSLFIILQHRKHIFSYIAPTVLFSKHGTVFKLHKYNMCVMQQQVSLDSNLEPRSLKRLFKHTLFA